MRLGLLGCAAALTLIGAAVAQAETIYITEPGIATEPDSVYAAPAPFASPSYVVTEPAPAVIAEPPASYVVVAPPVLALVNAPLMIAPRQQMIERERVVVAPRERLIARERVAPRPRVVTNGRAAAPRERVVERERVIVTPREEERVIVAPREQVVVAPRESVPTGFSTTGSCFIDLNGFERCY